MMRTVIFWLAVELLACLAALLAALVRRRLDNLNLDPETEE